MFYYTRGRTLKDTLCPSDSHEKNDCRFLGKPKRGTFPCLSCVCCASIIKGNTVSHPTKGTQVKLRHYTTCDSKHVVYMLKCPCGLIYIGQTIRAAKERIKEHRGNIRNFKMGTARDTSVSRHFHMEGHNVSQLKWMILEQAKMGRRYEKILAQKEAFWIKKINTMASKGMNDHWSIIPFLG
ncbi:hypothetical protein XELAEV_18046794mg [Xenopus laevis]|uniref:GIY-YIG domain-containing protein n=1 Tax=Xenopus laevis TaxID=8355 RepID=A0A974BU19_XENLA|nr:hypothetical protein XELAEV_18046794mg [Xenopus laevis]